MINQTGLIKYLGISFVAVFFLFGCSSGGSDSGAGGGGGVTTGSGSTVITTQGTVAPPGTLGDLLDTGDLVNAGDNWYETRIMALGENGNVVGQTTRSGGPVKAAFLLVLPDPLPTPPTPLPTMTYLGIHAGLYDPADLDSNPFIYSEAVGIGPTGDVICNSTTGIGWPEEMEKRAFYYPAGGVFTDLPPLTDGSFSEAHGISQDYVIFNREWEKDGDISGWYWDKGAGFGVLGGIVGSALVVPVGINSNNQAVLNSEETTAVFHDLDVDAIQSLNHLPGASLTTASAINESLPTGHIVGKSGDMAFFWDGGSMYPCGTLGGSTSEATDLNDLDQVVGHSTTASGATHAFVWQLDASGQGVMTDLGTLGGENSYATAINNNGLIVGYAETGAIYSQGGVTQPIVHACAWYGNVIYDLGIHNDFYTFPFVEPYPFSEAIDVNDNNRIAGNSYTINQHYRGFVLDAPVP